MIAFLHTRITRLGGVSCTILPVLLVGLNDNDVGDNHQIVGDDHLSTGRFSNGKLVVVDLALPANNGEPQVPALFFFGDSTVDVGNNNLISTIVKANFFPFGKDFVISYPTGRFSNGKLVIDFVSETLGFTTYQPAYLNLAFKGKNILTGANFASGGSGYHDSTSEIYHTLSMDMQLKYYKDCQKAIMRIVGRSSALSIISGAIYIVSAGSVDFAMNYYAYPLLKAIYTPEKFADILVQNSAHFIQNLYALGARKIGIATLPAIGCFPAIIHVYGSAGSHKCVGEINDVAIYFNQKLNSTSVNLRKMLPGLNLALLDCYQPLYNLVTRPSEYGFSETRTGCWRILEESTNKFSVPKIFPLCSNASKYVFWDGIHPTEAANKFLAAEMIADGISLIS